MLTLFDKFRILEQDNVLTNFSSVSKIAKIHLTSSKEINLDNIKPGDILTYAVVIENLSKNVDAQNVKLMSFTQDDVSFVLDSMYINDECVLGENPLELAGANIGLISSNSSVKVIFDVRINTITSKNALLNITNVEYEYINSPGNILDNQEEKNIEYDLTFEENDFNQSVDKQYVDLQEVIEYTFTIKNSGHVMAKDIEFINCMPNGLRFIKNSVKINDTIMLNMHPTSIFIGNLEINSNVNIKFNAVVENSNGLNEIINKAVIKYKYDCEKQICEKSNESNTTCIYVQYAQIIEPNFNKSCDKLYAGEGEIIKYNLVFKNTGNAPAENVILKELIPDNIRIIEPSIKLNNRGYIQQTTINQINIGDVDAGEVIEIEYEAKIISDSIGKIQTSSILEYKYKNGEQFKCRVIKSNQTNTFINKAYVCKNKHQVSKKVNKEYAKLDDEVMYTVYLFNPGNIMARNVVIKEQNSKEIELIDCNIYANDTVVHNENLENEIFIGCIMPGQKIKVEIKSKILKVPNDDYIKSISIIDYDYMSSPDKPPVECSITSNEVITKIKEAKISSENGGFVMFVDKSFSYVGDILVYTLNIKNTGNTRIENANIRNVLPNGVEFVQSSVVVDSRERINLNPNVGMEIGSINPNQVITVTFKAKVISVNEYVFNKAQIDYNFIIEENKNYEYCTCESNVVKTKINTALIDNECSVFLKSVDKSIAGYNDILTYTLTIQNMGSVDADNVLITDVLEKGLEFVEESVMINTMSMPNDNPNVGIKLGSIAPNEMVIVTFMAKVVGAFGKNNMVSNSADIKFQYMVSPYVIKDASCESNIVETKIDAAIISSEDGGFIKSADKQAVTLGDEIEYNIIIKNTGNIKAEKITVTDQVPSGFEFVNKSVVLNGKICDSCNVNDGIYIKSIDPDEIFVISFKVVAVSLKNQNPIKNIASVDYEYTLSDGSVKQVSNVSNAVYANINSAIISNVDGGFVKNVDKDICQINDILTYTILIKNTGNVIAENVIVLDNLPCGVEFIPCSILINSKSVSGINIEKGINIGTISPKELIILKFKVKVKNTMTFDDLINSAKVKYIYKVDESYMVKKENTSNLVQTQIKQAILKIDQSSDRICNIDSGSMIIYNIDIKNIGNIQAKNIFVKDDLSLNLEFVKDSVKINEVESPCDDIEIGIRFLNISEGESVNISFEAKSKDTNCVQTVYSKSYATYFSNSKQEKAQSNVVELTLTPNSSSQLMLYDCFELPKCKPNIGEISEVSTNVTILDFYKLNSGNGICEQDEYIPSATLLVRGKIEYIVEYGSNCEEILHFVHFNKVFTTYISIPKNIDDECLYEIEDVVEGVDATMLNNRSVVINTTLFLNVLLK